MSFPVRNRACEFHCFIIYRVFSLPFWRSLLCYLIRSFRFILTLILFAVFYVLLRYFVAQFLSISSRPNKLVRCFVIFMILQVIYPLLSCDLAGSERIKATGVEGERLQEAQHINLSLLELGYD